MFKTTPPAGMDAGKFHANSAVAFLDSTGSFRVVRAGTGSINSAVEVHLTELPLLLPVGL
jgi:hypothetical protein